VNEVSPTPMRLPRAMTVRQAADMLGLSPWTVYLLVESGEIPAFHVGPAKDGPETKWIHPADVVRYASRRDYSTKVEHVPDDQICGGMTVAMGKEHARTMSAMLVDLTGSSCRCTRGEACQFMPREAVDA